MRLMGKLGGSTRLIIFEMEFHQPGKTQKMPKEEG